MRSPPLILIVDDNPANVDIFETRLAAQGYDIITADDGEEGLAAAREHQPDLVSTIPLKLSKLKILLSGLRR